MDTPASAQSEWSFEDRFDQAKLDDRWRWFNPPPIWQIGSPAGLTVRPAAQTDFWQETHYGFRADNGHFLCTEVAGDFSISTQVRFQPVNQYDQAGLMVRSGPRTWIKTSVEFEPDGPARLGAVVTNEGSSDWSVQNFPRERLEVRLRIRREGSDFIIEFAADGHSDWMLMRIAHLHLEPGAPLSCGLYACSPKGAGFRAEFDSVQMSGAGHTPKIPNTPEAKR